MIINNDNIKIIIKINFRTKMTIEIIINCNFFYLVKTIKGIKTIKGTSKEITSKTKIEDIIITIIDLKTLIIIKILTKIKNLIY